MDYINVGAHIGDRRAKTKKALRDALADDPASVVFDVISAFHNGGPSVYTGDDVPAGVALSVVGPDPYTNRAWYATVSRCRDGRARLT